MAETSAPIVAVHQAVTALWKLATDIDQRLKGGGLATPRSDREHRMAAHWNAVGLRSAAMAIEQALGLEGGDLNAHRDGTDSDAE